MNKDSKMIWLWVLIGFSALFCLLFIIEEIITGKLMYTYIAIVLLVVIVVKCVIDFFINHKFNKKVNKSNVSKEVKVMYGNKINELIDFNFDFGDFGIIEKDKLNCENVPRLTHDINDSKSIEYSVGILKDWSDRVKKYKNYIVNYFMYEVWFSVYNLDIMFWEKYRKNEDKMSNEECYEIFKSLNTKEFMQEMDKYLKIDTQSTIRDAYDKLNFFDYDEFMRGLDIHIYIAGDDCLAITIKDKYNSVLDVFEVFDKNLQGLDYHNDIVKR
jgi:hypothetical protein